MQEVKQQVLKVIYTDGSCRPNPGRGGWAVVLSQDGELVDARSGKERHTTNNRMELMAAVVALEWVSGDVTMYTDSRYVKNGITGWIEKWKRNGWRTAKDTPVKNEDLWRRLDAACCGRKVSWHWVRGHAGDRFNELADALARF